MDCLVDPEKLKKSHIAISATGIGTSTADGTRTG